MSVNTVNNFGINNIKNNNATQTPYWKKTQPYQNNTFTSFNRVKNNGEKVNFSEGVKLVGRGFLDKVKNIGKSIIKHPVKTLGVALGTAAAISLLPLIGISSALGASVLGVGFAGLAIGKTVAHSVKAVKHNKNGEYNDLRNDLKNIGGDCVDLGLSLPFLPKAVKTIQRNIKYGPTIGFNKELFNNIKNAKGFDAKYLELQKGNLKINYETISNEIGLKVKPELVFDNTLPSGEMFQAGEYEPTTGVLKINTKLLSKKMQILTRTTPEEFLKHELTHFQQFSDIARTEGVGVDGLEQLLIDYYSKADKLGALPPSNAKIAQNMLNGDRSMFNKKFYNDIVTNTDPILKGSPEAALSQSYADGLIAKVTTQIDELSALNIGIIPTNKEMKQILEIYKKNPLEKPAYAAQDAYASYVRKRPGEFADIAMAESATTPNEFKQQNS